MQVINRESVADIREQEERLCSIQWKNDPGLRYVWLGVIRVGYEWIHMDIKDGRTHRDPSLHRVIAILNKNEKNIYQ